MKGVYLALALFLVVCSSGEAVAQNLNQMLHVGARTGQHAAVENLLASGQVAVNSQDSSGWTALMKASYPGHDKIVRLLLDAGASVDVKTNQGETALILAAQYGQTEAARLLLEAEADPNAADEAGRTAYTWASWGENEELVELLDGAGSRSGASDPFAGAGPPVRMYHEPPKQKKGKSPKYTKSYRERGINGDLILEIVVLRDGKVDPGSIRVVESISDDVDQEAVDLVRKWKFEPGTIQGKPVNGLLHVEVQYRSAIERVRVMFAWSTA